MIGIYLQKTKNVFIKVAYIATVIVAPEMRSNVGVAPLFYNIIFFNIIKTTYVKMLLFIFPAILTYL